MLRAYIINPKNNKGGWFTFPLYFGKLTRIGHTGNYNDYVEIRNVEGFDNISLGLYDLEDLEKLNRLAEKLNKEE
ncbi:hypothetical protein N1495_01325 [Streptococcus didelphis]|uniref:Uncharacterized protein n=1 Tax=Streptococcus didelphis TaxID=102886 RepID=A0ABY9LG14_9STRE|nr:hypothetical protein [Streptococcus didelphis]WMB27849.1 hypothetical protein N1496_07285 [Streptococcus didelphis]WMB29689.1 hypothetical protein N1495_01325 [Streptococcus didelphis]